MVSGIAWDLIKSFSLAARRQYFSQMPILNEDSAEYGKLADELKLAWHAAKKLAPAAREKLLKKKTSGPLPDLEKQILALMRRYEDSIVANVKLGSQSRDEAEPRNLYELVGANRLAAANNVSRSISTELGSAWERLAALSHVAISPELDFGVRIAGVDVIILAGDRLRHTQIKTQCNTLTGSQKPRSVAELEMYDYPLFAAAFDVANWTFSSPKIERVAGREFWKLLQIPYQYVESAAQNCLLGVEKRVLGS